MPTDFRIESLRFSGSTEPITVADSDLIVLIGPNNAGKSAALREIEAFVRHGYLGPVLTTVSTIRTGSVEELDGWLMQVAPRVDDINNGRCVMSPTSVLVPLQAVSVTWSHMEHLAMLTDFLVKLLDAEGRLGLVSRAPNVALRDGHAIVPLQRLLQNPDAERELSDVVMRAFGSPVTLTRAGGGDLQLLLGTTTAEAKVNNPDYLQELRALPAIEDQGDGMRSFIGVLLTLIATQYRLILIDEPEAFLHPPQARELGRQLAGLGESQRFIATHDSDVLLGLLERSERMTIIRLRREGEHNIPAVLEKEQVTVLWNDPSFRYSNLLDGLFHKGVVICEADGDATLYSAALDAQREAAGEAAADILFTQCGGKHKMPAAIGALVPMGVPVAAILDIDALRDASLLEKIIDALGEGWERVSDDWSIVAAAIGQMPVDAPTVGSVQGQIASVLGEDPTAVLSETQTRRIREITRSRDGWRRIRDAGIAAVPNGDATAAATRLLADLAEIGVFVVSVGSLEGWAPQIGGHGPLFVDRALTDGVHRQAEIQAFVADAAEFLLAN